MTCTCKRCGKQFTYEACATGGQRRAYCSDTCRNMNKKISRAQAKRNAYQFLRLIGVPPKDAAYLRDGKRFQNKLKEYGLTYNPNVNNSENR